MPDNISMGSLVIFDNDGTLADSLPPHVAFCRRMNEQHKCGLSLPSLDDVPAMRDIAAAPMDNFLIKAGFPSHIVSSLVTDYEESFAKHHPVGPFPGVSSMLSDLTSKGVRLAVVSSNTSVNVKAALGPEISSKFEVIYGIDNADRSKLESIRMALKALNATTAVYVGDTAKDKECALEAGCDFIGVGYGFEDMGEASAASVEELGRMLDEKLGIP